VARVDRKRLEEALALPEQKMTRFAVQTRFDDLDIQGHINNVAVMALFQEARVDFNRQSALVYREAGLRMMAAGITVEYAGEMYHPEPTEIFTGVLVVGRSSFTLGQIIRQCGRITAYCETTMVLADGHGPAALLPDMRLRLQSFAI